MADDVLKQIRAFGLTFPGTHLKSPWPDHMDLAVKDKTFAYLPLEGQPFRIGVKLPISNEKVLMLPGAQPTGYGLGKSGWVDVNFPGGAAPPIELLREWIEESYRAQAPKSLVKQLDASRAGGTTSPGTPSAKARSLKPSVKKQSAKKP